MVLSLMEDKSVIVLSVSYASCSVSVYVLDCIVYLAYLCSVSVYVLDCIVYLAYLYCSWLYNVVLRKWRKNTSKKTKELSITFIPTDRLTRELERNIEYLKLIFLLPIEVLFLLTCSLLWDTTKTGKRHFW